MLRARKTGVVLSTGNALFQSQIKERGEIMPELEEIGEFMGGNIDSIKAYLGEQVEEL